MAGLLVIVLAIGGCGTRRDHAGSSTVSSDSSVGAPAAPTMAGSDSTVAALPESARILAAAAEAHGLWREITTQREALRTHLEAREWADVKERAGRLRDQVAAYAGRFDRTSPIVAAQMNALSEAIAAATQDLIQECDREALVAARRQLDRIQSILKQIADLARET